MFEGLYSWSAVAPTLVVLATALIVMLVDLFVKPGSRIVPWLTIVGLLAGLAVTIGMWGTEEVAFSGAWKIGAYSLFFYALFIVAAIITILFTLSHEQRRGRFPGEYWSLITFSVVGMMVMASAADLITLIIGLETMSLCAYVMVGLNRNDPRSSEGALKYFLLGAFASAFLLYGAAFIYGSVVTTRFSEIGAFIAAHGDSIPFTLQVGGILLLVGLGFKVAAVPFHMWAPDAYQAAPTPVTGFMATAVKAAGFAAIVKIFGLVFASSAVVMQDLIWWLALLSMIVGNFAAVMQMNLKRMLAYSSVAHVGYLLTAIVGSDPGVSLQGGTGVLFYLVSYTLMTLGAFGVLIIIGGGEDRRETLVDLTGLASKSPGLALAMTIFMVSMSGIPPTIGFFGKFYVFGAAVQSGYTGLAVIGILTSVVGVFYYFRVVVNMYMKPAEKSFVPYRRSRISDITLGVLAVAVIYLGIFPQSLLSLARNAFQSLF